MRYHILATDFDGTLAHDGVVAPETISALQRLADSGRKLVLVTGREMPALKAIFPAIKLFDWVVAENGGLLYQPSTDKEILLGEQAPKEFVEMLTQRGVGGISVGRCVVATWSPHENVVLDTIRDLGLELHVVFNKGAVMVLPPAINKATGLQRVLLEMGLSPHNAIGVGDAENDHAFLKLCEFSAATANALPALKDAVDLVLQGDHGAGVIELIDQVLEDDLRDFHATTRKHRLLIGSSETNEVCLPPFGGPVIICGPSGSGKSTLANRIVDAIMEHEFQFCLVDPEGDFESFEGAIVLGGPNAAPQIEEAMHALEKPTSNVVLCLTGIPIPDRPTFFLQLLGQLNQLRTKAGRPHWLILDEAHHLMPANWQPPTELLPNDWTNVVLITVNASSLPLAVLQRVEVMAIVGQDAEITVNDFANTVGRKSLQLPPPNLETGEVWLWNTNDSTNPIRFRALKSDREHSRHRRKYAEGQLAPEKSFYFRGPNDALNLRAQNLILFYQIAEGIDDETWDYHLKRNDFSRWFIDCIHDENLATEADLVASQTELSVAESKSLILAAIQRDYILLPTSRMSVPGAM